MPQRLIGRAGRVITALGRFYRSGTGLVLGAGTALGIVLAFTVSAAWGVVVVAVIVAVVVPYRLMRLDAARLSTQSQLDRLRKEEATTRARAGQIGRDVLGAVATLRDECNALLRSERMIWMDTVAALRSDVESGLADASRRTGQLARRVDESDEVQQERLLDAVADVRATIEHERLVQASTNRLLSARRDARSQDLDRVLVIVSAPRFGSSWLHDALRRHSDVGVYPTVDLFARLGASGRRYPAALSDALTDGVEVEVQAGIGGLVPGGHSRIAGVDGPWRPPRFVVERVQPSAIDFDPTGFADRVDALRSDLGGEHHVQTIFMTRDPVDAIRSFLVYRSRHPAWHDEIPDEFVHDFYRRSYESIDAIRQLLPGAVVTWEALRDEPARRLARLLCETGVEPEEAQALRVATEMVSGAVAGEDDSSDSDRDIPDASLVELGIGTPDPARAQDAIGRAREVHQRLSRSSTGSTGSPARPPTHG